MPQWKYHSNKLDLQYQFRKDLKNLEKAGGLDLAPKVPKSQSNRKFIGFERSLGRRPQMFTQQSPKDPLPMCKEPEDTLEGHLSMSCQVRAGGKK